MNTTSRMTAGLLLAAACMAASAQTTPAMPASQPAAVGVTPDTARAANDKAVQRSDVATVVRTGPTAADKARQVKADIGASSASAPANDSAAVAANAMSGNANRAPRTDRN